jgi:hypothetical protein
MFVKMLRPNSKVPLHEKWLFDNKATLKKVTKGLEDSKADRLVKKGSFSQFIDDAP